MERQQLIDRKHAVQGQIRSLRPRVERAHREAANRRDKSRATKLQHELDDLMTEEMNLRLQIDRAPH